MANRGSTPRFPDMRALTDFIHAKGLRAGIYTSPGPLTCPDHTAAWEHEAADVERFVEWGEHHFLDTRHGEFEMMPVRVTVVVCLHSGAVGASHPGRPEGGLDFRREDFVGKIEP